MLRGERTSIAGIGAFVLAALAVSSNALAQNRAPGTVIGVAYHSSGKGCLNMKTAAGWAWETHPGGTVDARAAVKKRLTSMYSPLFGEIETAPLRSQVAIVIGFEKPLPSRGCSPRRLIVVGHGTDSSTAYADALKEMRISRRDATAQYLGIVRKP
jgi:hypothetical protein